MVIEFVSLIKISGTQYGFLLARLNKLVALEPIRGYPAMYEPHTGPSYGDRAGKVLTILIKFNYI